MLLPFSKSVLWDRVSVIIALQGRKYLFSIEQK